jgi:hypothetical protein
MRSRNILFQDEEKSTYTRDMIEQIVAKEEQGDK